MIEILIWAIILVIALAVLIKGADWFTDAAEALGIHLGIPPFIVGVTIVAFGTSLPELVSSIIAVSKGTSEIVAANAIGSNIANIFLILGCTAIIGKKLKITHEIMHVDIPLLVGSAFLLAILAVDGSITVLDGIILLVGLLIYLLYTINSESDNKNPAKKPLNAKVWGFLLFGGFLIYLGAEFTVRSVINLSQFLGIATDTISVTVVALGTSLPELVVSVKAALKGKAEMAIGNVLGSNIFNTFAVLGIPALIGSLAITRSILMFSLPLMLVATLLFVFIAQDKEVTRWEG